MAFIDLDGSARSGWQVVKPTCSVNVFGILHITDSETAILPIENNKIRIHRLRSSRSQKFVKFVLLPADDCPIRVS